MDADALNADENTVTIGKIPGTDYAIVPLLAPTLVENAGLPLTPYYQYLLALKQVAPVVTAANDYMDADGVTHTYGENAELDAWVHGYFYLEYNNIGAKATSQQNLFQVEK